MGGIITLSASSNALNCGKKKSEIGGQGGAEQKKGGKEGRERFSPDVILLKERGGKGGLFYLLRVEKEKK